MKPRIAVIDYGMGNLRSVGKALELAGADVKITSDKQAIRSAQAIVLPGVGSFEPAINYIKQKGLDKVIKSEIASGKPYLGLCLGFQMLFSESFEDGRHKGLGVFKGKVKRFDFSSKPSLKKKLKIPHMGWNNVAKSKNSGNMFKGVEDGAFFYFVHSYYVLAQDDSVVAGRTDYGIRFCSAIKKDNVWAFQFHPEKSGETGIRLLKNFVNEVR